MSNVQVKIDNKDDPTCLTFNPQKVPINNSPNAQPITWNLAGPINTGGTFVRDSLQFDGGLPSCMTAPVYAADGKGVSLTDTNNNAPGEWFYSLQVLWNGKVYGPCKKPDNIPGSPSIQNK